MNAHDVSGHWPWILAEVDGGFSFFAEVAAHLFFPCAAGAFKFCATRFGVEGMRGRLPWVDRADQPRALLRNAVGILRHGTETVPVYERALKDADSLADFD